MFCGVRLAFEELLRCVIDLITHDLVCLALVIATAFWGNFLISLFRRPCGYAE
jgi:hypothetical protein